MQAIFSGKLSILVFLLFPALLAIGFLMRRVVSSMSRDLDMAKYILERGPIEEAPQPPPPEEVLPGCIWTTKQDYEEMRARTVKELRA